MESITNAATAMTNAASSMLGYGNNNNATTTQEHESGQEPVSGLKGEGTAAEPFDQGNKVDDPVLGGESYQKTSTTGSSPLGTSTLGSSTTGSSTHPTSSITDNTSSATSGGLNDPLGRTTRETAEMVASAPIQGQEFSGTPLSGTNSTSGFGNTYNDTAGTKTHINAPTAVTSGSIAPNKHDGTSAILAKDNTSSVTDHAIGSTDKHSYSNSLAPNIAAAGGAGTVTGSPATHVKSSTSHTSSATGTSGVDEHSAGKQKLSDKIKEKLHIGSEHKKH